MHHRHLFVVPGGSLFSFVRSKSESYLLRLVYLFSFAGIFAQNMGCFQSTGNIDFDTIQPAVLQTRGGSVIYSGTTERGRCQVSFNS
jgi:hypothetical protein